MTAAKKRNINLVFRLLLLSSYIFLFTTQINARFFSIANFYVYGNEAAGSQAETPPLHQQDKSLVYHKSPDRSAHLSLDKRFQLKHAVRASFPIYTIFPFAEAIEREYNVPARVYSSFADLPPNALRGPPCA